MKLYRSMFKQALSITWRNKFLWFFGLFAVLLGNGGAYNLGFNNLSKVETQGIWLNNIKTIVQNWSFKFHSINFPEVWSTVGFSGILLMLFILAVVIFFIWLAIASQGALIYGSMGAIKGRQDKFNQALKHGLHKFWAVFMLNFIFSIILLILLALLSLPFFILFMVTAMSIIWQSILVVLSFVVWVPLAIIFFIIIKYALIYAVNENNHIGEALYKAIYLFAKNWLVSLETGLILFLLNIITTLLLAVAMVFVILPFVMLGMLAVGLSSTAFLWLILTLGLLTFIGMIFLYGAVWTVFTTTVWVILFEKINQGVAHSKILRWAGALTRHKPQV